MAEIRHRDGSTGVKVKLHDKISALDKLAKMLGMYRDDRGDRENRPLNITRVTINFPDGSTESWPTGGRAGEPYQITRTGPTPQHVIDGESRTLPGDSEDSHA